MCVRGGGGGHAQLHVFLSVCVKHFLSVVLFVMESRFLVVTLFFKNIKILFISHWHHKIIQ